MLNEHSDEYFVKGFARYCCIDRVIEADDWESLRADLKRVYNDDWQVFEKRLFDEFKFYNCVLKVEHAITGLLNDFFVKNNLIRDWEVLHNEFTDKIARRERTTKENAIKILKEQTDGETERILTPALMLYYVGYGIGELIDYIQKFIKNFPRKKELVKKLTLFNESRKIIIHNLLTSREDVDSKIEHGIMLGKEITSLIDEIIKNQKV